MLGLGLNMEVAESSLKGFTGILDEYSGAAAAYSVRRLSSSYTGDAIRVRKSSDDTTEQDIGFDANGDLDTTALLAFVNADVDTYSSDFTSGTDGWFANRGTADGNIDGISDGTTSKDDVLRLTLSNGATNHSVRLNGVIDLGNVHDVSFDYYIPSTRDDGGGGTIAQTIDGIKFQTSSGLDGNYQQSVVGTWTSVTIEDWSITGGDQFRVYATDGGSISPVDADDDVFYLKNIVVTQTTADGFVTKIYNQSGTGGSGLPSDRDLVQGTESKQAKIVDSNVLLTEGSKPCIKANIIGTTVYGTYEMSTAYEIPQPSFSIFSVLAHGSTQTTYVISGSTIGSDRLLLSAGRLRYNINGSGNYDISQTIDQTRAIDMYMNDGTLTYHQNNSEIGSIDVSASNGNSFEFKNLGSGGNNNNIEEFQELIIFPEDKDTQRGDIRDNMKTYFSVY